MARSTLGSGGVAICTSGFADDVIFSYIGPMDRADTVAAQSCPWVGSTTAKVLKI